MLPRDFIIRYSQALASQDWDKVKALIHHEACVTFSTGETHFGKEEIEAAYKRNFALIKNETYRISDVFWVWMARHFAVYIFDFSWSGEVNGKQVSGEGVGTTTLVQERGRWLLLAEHLGPKKG